MRGKGHGKNKDGGEEGVGFRRGYGRTGRGKELYGGKCWSGGGKLHGCRKMCVCVGGGGEMGCGRGELDGGKLGRGKQPDGGKVRRAGEGWMEGKEISRVGVSWMDGGSSKWGSSGGRTMEENGGGGVEGA
jgi:hypothetical protein